MIYDDNNIFAKIIRGEIPCKKVYEDEYTLAFYDVNPLAPVHILVIPKGKYISQNDFAEKASDEEIAALNKAIVKVAKEAEIAEKGYRVVTNIGSDGGQEVKHLHFHILGGHKMGAMVPRK
ncbi:MAG: histidine triad nucleotide-binding protein [Alphaproteobacteria bacterium]